MSARFDTDAPTLSQPDVEMDAATELPISGAKLTESRSDPS